MKQKYTPYQICMIMTKFWNRHGADFFKEKAKIELSDTNLAKYNKITEKYFDDMYKLYYEIENQNTKGE